MIKVREDISSATGGSTFSDLCCAKDLCCTFSAALVVGDSHKGPLNNRGKPAYLRKKQTRTNLKARTR
jgi:hypothetical protein